MSEARHAVRVTLPFHLQTLARCASEITLEVDAPVTIGAVLDKLETRYPMLKGTVREHVSGKRRMRVRFFAEQKDYSHLPQDTVLPDSVAAGDEPFMIIGAIAGG